MGGNCSTNHNVKTRSNSLMPSLVLRNAKTFKQGETYFTKKGDESE